MKLVNHDAFSHIYTDVFCENDEDQKFNAPHHFIVKDKDGNMVCAVDFQEGPIKENGVNGCSNEDLILMIVSRLESFQNSDFKCSENEAAIDFLMKAINSLRARTNKRIERGVEGTSSI